MTFNYGIISRISKSELPYLKRFVEHHKSSGFSYFYFIVQDPLLKSEVKSILSFEHLNIEIFIHPTNLSVENSLKHFNIKSIKSDYLLSIDIDEYFYDQEGRSIDKSMALMGYPEVIFFPWILAPNDFSLQDRLQGFFGHTGKSMAMTKFIVNINTSHTFKFNNLNLRDRAINSKSVFLIHYWGRGFKDILLKCIYHKEFYSGDPKYVDDIKKIIEQNNINSIPFRLKLLASLTRHKSNIAIPDLISNGINFEIENFLLHQQLLDTDFKKIKNLYLIYKEKLNYEKHVSIYPAIGTLLDMKKYLP